jgi:nucleotidyltransferase substrate binding protein (TIGR01987 family)
MDEQDTRWEQRYANFNKALSRLTRAVELAHERPLSELEEQGLIQAFEFTHELAWNVMKDYAHYQGNAAVAGSRDATREAFSLQLIADGKGWMEMITSRNKTSHTYNEDVAREIADTIVNKYLRLFTDFQQTMADKRGGNELS